MKDAENAEAELDPLEEMIKAEQSYQKRLFEALAREDAEWIYGMDD